MREPLPQVTPFLRIGGREWHVPAALSALGHRNYRLYWSSQLVSLTGSWMQSTAQQWLVYRLTGSPLALGWVTFLSALPVTLLSLPAGAVIDRVDKRRFLVGIEGTMMVLAFTLAALTATDLVRYWHVLVLAALLGIANTFDMPARHALTAEMVGKPDLMNAIALNSSIFNGARLLGPAIAGALVAWKGETVAFAANGFSFLAVIAALLAMKLPAHVPKSGRLRPISDSREGLAHLLRTRRTLVLVLMAAIPSIFGFPFSTLLPVMARERLGLGPEGFGMLISSFGLGALVAALSLAALGHVRSKGLLLNAARATFAAAIAVFALSTWLPLSLAALAVAGWGMIAHLATTNTMIQLQTPDELRGRVMAAYVLGVVGTAPLGALFFGSLAERMGAPSAILVGAAACAVSVAGSLLLVPEARDPDPPGETDAAVRQGSGTSSGAMR